MRVADTLRREIEQGVLQPGDRLPPLADLATRFGCSRATVREALGALRGQGLVEIRHGDGTYVRTASVELWMQPLDAAVLLAASDASQLVELLTAVLAGVAAAAADRASETERQALLHKLFQLECAAGTGEEAVSAELSLHQALAAAAGNPLLENVMRVLQEALRSAIRLARRNGLDTVPAARSLVHGVVAGQAALARFQAYAYGDALAVALANLRRGEASTKTLGASPSPTLSEIS
ncbi:MAG: GntR family transcriptional regulator [Alicyclobacillus sp.]|nr:GntR family transcriptional regulator [Alicyclobacillus sp.]